MMRTTSLLLTAALLAGCSRGVSVSSGTPPSEINARAELALAGGQPAGTLSLVQTPHGVLITGQLSNLPPGLHAIHVHETGRCEPPFTTAGAHFNPGSRAHGFRREQGPHAGDLPNLRASDAGTAHVELLSSTISLASGAGNLFDGDGSSLVVHAGADDYSTDPSGNSGSRIACGAIVR